MAFEEAINKAWEMQVRKFVTEFWYMGNSDWQEDLTSACEKFSKILDRME